MFSRETAPEPGNRFRLRLRLRCVRACVRAKLCARMIFQWLGVVGCDFPGVRSVRPGPAGPRSSCLSGQLTLPNVFFRVHSC